MSKIEFTCPSCGSHDLAVERVYQDWAPNGMWAKWFASAHLDSHQLPPEGQWDRKVVEVIGSEKPSAATDEEWSILCQGCRHDIPFGWSQENRGGWVWPAESPDFEPEKVWMEPRHAGHQ